MTVRIKRRYRLAVLLACTAIVIGTAAGLYTWRKSQLQHQAINMRTEGMAAFEAGDYYNALHKLGKYLHKYPDDAQTTYHYAQARLKVVEPGAKHILQAMGVLRRLLDLQPDHPTARRELLRLYIQTGFRSETLSTAEALLKDNADDSEAVRAKFDSLIAMREFDKALAAAEEYLDHAPNGKDGLPNKSQIEAMRAKVIVLSAKHQLEEALVFAQQYNQHEPLDLNGHMSTFWILRELDRPDVELVERAQELRSAYPDNPSFELLQAVAYRIANDRENTVKWLHAVAQRKITDENLLHKLVSELDAVGLYQESLSVLEDASQQMEGDGLRRMLVYRLVQAGRPKRVDELLKKAGLDPQRSDSDSELLGLHAIALNQLDRQEEAIAIVEGLASRRDDRIAEAWVAFHRGISFQDNPKPADVIEVCKAGLNHHTRNPFFLYFMGNAYASLGETELALDAWHRAATYAPTWAMPLARQANALVDTERRKQAVLFAQAAFQRAPKDISVATTLVVAVTANLESIGDDKLDNLLVMVNEIQRVLPGQEQTLPIQVLLLARTGDQAAAREILQAALDAEKPLSQATLLRLARVSGKYGLGLEEACNKLAEKTYQLTPALAYERATRLLTLGQPEQGLQLLEAAAGERGNATNWKVAIARYLDVMQDPRARAAWISLGDEMPNDPRVQRMVVQSRSAWQDMDFVDRTIERLRIITGDDGLAWRTARAKWTFQQSTGRIDLEKAASLLGDVILRAPRSIEPRLLLAQCFEGLGNHTGAIEQLSQAARISPGNLDVVINLARLHQSQGDYSEADIYLNHIAKSQGNATPEQIYRTTRLLANQGDVDTAIQMLEPLYENNKASAVVGIALAELYQQNNNTDKAQHICQQLLQEPTAAVIRFAVDFYASQGHKDLADEALAHLEDLELPSGVREQITGDYLARFVSVERAIEQYQAAIQKAPDNANLWRRLIAYQISLGQGDEAVRTAKQALKSIPDDDILINMDRHAGLVTSSAANATLRPIILGLLGGDDNRLAAVKTLEIFADVDAGKISTDDTLSALHRLANSHASFLPLQNLVAKIFTMADRHEDAVLISTRAMQRFPNNPQPVRIAMEALAAAGRWDEALGVAKRLRERVVNNPIGADLMISEAKLRLGDVKGASGQLEPYLTQALDKPEIYAQVLVGYARTLIAAGDTQQAADLLAPFLDQSPQWRGAWIRLAALAIADQDVAATWLEKVNSHIPADGFDELATLVQSWNVLTTRSQKTSYRDRAKHLIDQIIQQPGASDRCWLIHAIMAEGDGQLKTAETSYRKALQLNPKLHVAKNNLAMVLTSQNLHLDEALILANQAVEALPRDPSYLDTLAFVHAESKNYEAALANIRKAIVLDPANPTWQKRLTVIQSESQGH